MLCLLLVGCQSECVVDKQNSESLAEIRLTIGNLSEQTRSMNPFVQNDAFDPDNEIGVFVLHEDVYRSMMTSTHKDSLLASGQVMSYDSVYLSSVSSYLKNGYGYLNVRCRVNASGDVTPVEPNRLLYPVNAGEKVVVLAYAPYSSEMTLDDLLKGFEFDVPLGQNMDADVVKADLITAVSNDFTPFREYQPVALDFSHQMSRVTFNLTVKYDSDIVDGTMDVSLLHVPSKTKMHLNAGYITCQSEGSVPVTTCYSDLRTCGSPMAYSPISMATVTDINVTAGTSVTYPLSVVVAPGQIETGEVLSYIVDINGVSVCLRDLQTTELLSGKALVHNCTLRYDALFADRIYIEIGGEGGFDAKKQTWW